MHDIYHSQTGSLTVRIGVRTTRLQLQGMPVSLHVATAALAKKEKPHPQPMPTFPTFCCAAFADIRRYQASDELDIGQDKTPRRAPANSMVNAVVTSSWCWWDGAWGLFFIDTNSMA